MKPVKIQVTYDFVCPWCWIGHHHLRSAIEQAGVPVQMQYMPFELNPGMPAGGISRREYRTRKFGSWERSQAKDAELTETGRRAGAEFRFDQIEVTPNSRLAHRLMRFAQEKDEAQKTIALYDAIYAAYFHEGRDIGALPVLVELAAAHGFDAAAVQAYLESIEGEAEVVEQELDAQARGIHGVPNFLIGGREISGAQPAALLAQALRAAASQEALI